MTTLSTTRTQTLNLVYISLAAVILAICSWISIPTLIPFTMQTFGVFLILGLLGGKRGAMAILVYLLLGAIGLPVFAGFSSGIGCILGSTGGYLAGFLLSALIMWFIEVWFGKSNFVLVLSMVLGLWACYAVGTIWFMFVYTNQSGSIGLWTALGWCVFPYLIPDVLKIGLAFTVCKRLSTILNID